MDTPLFSAMFSFIGVFYAVTVPATIVLILTLLFIPAMHQPGAKARDVSHAIYCYLMQTIGVLLMTAGALPTLISVLAGVSLESSTYFSLLLLFAVGGWIFLWHEALAEEIPGPSRVVIQSIFVMLFQIIGHMAILVWGLSLLITFFTGIPEEAGWWILPAVMIAYGLLVTWCAHGAQTILPHNAFAVFKLNPPAVPQKTVAARKKTKTVTKARRATSKTKTPKATPKKKSAVRARRAVPKTTRKTTKKAPAKRKTPTKKTSSKKQKR